MTGNEVGVEMDVGIDGVEVEVAKIGLVGKNVAVNFGDIWVGVAITRVIVGDNVSASVVGMGLMTCV